MLAEACAAAEECVIGAGVDVANRAGPACGVPPRVLAQSLPGLAHSHEPTTLPRVPGCLFCARSGNALAAGEGERGQTVAIQEERSIRALPRPDPRDAVARLQLPLLRATLAAYDALLDELRARGLDAAQVESVRAELVGPQREFLEHLERALGA